MPFSLNQLMFWKRRRSHLSREIDPDEVMIDSSNRGHFDRDQFEGRLERPISRVTLYVLFGLFIIIGTVFIVQATNIQLIHGDEYRARSERNMLRPVPVFAGRGVIFDRNGIELAWNAPGQIAQATTTRTLDDSVARREFINLPGLAHVIGYVQYPSKDSNGFYYQEDFKGVDGAERYFNERLQGKNGSRLVEVDARGTVVSDSVVRPATQGENITLSIDSRVQGSLHRSIKDIADKYGFSGGAGVIMDVRTGEVIALTSYPEYSPEVMSSKTDTLKIKSLLADTRMPFLDRAIDGLYVPGSIVKPYMAMAALTEKVIAADTVIRTTGSISIPNPYDSTKSTVFRDWKNHGALDMRHAIAWSSDVYFYIVGGGYKDMEGLGIVRIDQYMKMFGLGSTTSGFFAGKNGLIPTPEWKKETFKEDWYVGNTYHTSIGQYGFLVTPMQMARSVSAIANSGLLINPTIIKDDGPHIDRTIDLPQKNFQIVREGMRLGTTDATSRTINVPYTHVAAKTGTAELGVSKSKVNSWVTGFWPYENPKYAFVVMLEKGLATNNIGTVAVMREQFDWMAANTPEYFK